MAMPLAGIRVLELGRVFAAPWAGQMLADLGAEVIKVEALEGDPMRQMGTGVIPDGNGNETSDRSVFAAVNRSKRSITIDLATEPGCELVRNLARLSDVLIENFKVGDLARRGLDYTTLSQLNPKLIYLSLTGYGQTGPYSAKPGMDNIIQGLSGYMSMTGEPDRPPQASPVSIMDFSAGMHATVGILAALYGRDQAGAPGQHIDLSLMESGLALVGYKMVAALLSGEQPARGSRTRGYVPSGVFETANGWLQMTVATDLDFKRFCETADREDLLQDPRFATRWTRTDHQDTLVPVIEQILRGRTTATWMDSLGRAGVMAGAVLTLAEAAEDPQVVARGAIMALQHDAGATIPSVRNPIRLSETPIENYSSPPLLGADTESILTGLLGMDRAKIDSLRQAGAIGPARQSQ
jgi:crotonobetainyl-CoA:carnitine CoA-transferase CaiB-like acyl-CoA transferase